MASSRLDLSVSVSQQSLHAAGPMVDFIPKGTQVFNDPGMPRHGESEDEWGDRILGALARLDRNAERNDARKREEGSG